MPKSKLKLCHYSVPPKKESGNGGGKDAADKAGKGDDKEELKSAEERLKETVRNAQACPLLYSLP